MKLLVRVIGQLFAHGIHSELIFGKHTWSLEANHEEALNYTRFAIKMIEAYGQDEVGTTRLFSLEFRIMGIVTISLVGYGAIAAALQLQCYISPYLFEQHACRYELFEQHAYHYELAYHRNRIQHFTHSYIHIIILPRCSSLCVT